MTEHVPAPVPVRGRDFRKHRIGGAIFVVIFGIAFLWQIYSIFANDNTVVPVVGWEAIARTDAGTEPVGTAAGEPARLLASEVLTQRTELQRERSVSGPAPDQPPPPLAVGTEERLITYPMGASDGGMLTQSWATADEQTLSMLRGDEKVVGWTAVPYPNAGLFERPEGRAWREGISVWETHTGAVAILGMLLLLALVLAIRGRVPIVEGRDGRTVRRFGFLERANHWMTAGSFILLALTGMILAFGKTLVAAFGGGGGTLGDAGWVSTWAHVMFAAPFFVGIVVMAVIWTLRNLPEPRLDLPWLARLGGFMSDSGDNPPARKFNAGQKVTFWIAVLGGLVMAGTGVTLMFPYFWLGVSGLTWMMLAHGLIGLLLIAFFVAHAYIGTLGMQDAIHAMWSGRVDLNWAREHHRLWLENELARKGELPPGYPPATRERGA